MINILNYILIGSINTSPDRKFYISDHGDGIYSIGYLVGEYELNFIQTGINSFEETVRLCNFYNRIYNLKPDIDFVKEYLT